MAYVRSVTVYPESIVLYEGDRYSSVVVSVYPSNECCNDVTWRSSNANVATVNQNGEITARSVGTATIFVTATDGSEEYDTISVTVKRKIIFVEAIELSSSLMYMLPGDSLPIEADVFPTNASNTSIKWNSSNEPVAVYDEKNHTIVAKSPGYAVITVRATDGSGVSDCCEVYVFENTLVTDVSVTPSHVELETGESVYLKATVLPSDASNKTLEWHSSSSAVSVNSSSGLVIARKEGIAYVTARATDGSGVSDCCAINVKNRVFVSSVNISNSEIELFEGDDKCLQATVLPANADNRKVNWYSSNSKVASVSNGYVVAKSEGRATITARAADGSGESDCCQVRVKKKIPVSEVSVSPSTWSMNVGEWQNLYATVCPSNAYNTELEWSVDGDGIGIVSVTPYSGTIGSVFAIKPGRATVRVKARDGSGKYATCVITVKKVPMQSFSINKITTTTLNVGETKYLTTTICPTNATEKIIVWHSSNQDVASVDYCTGRVRAKKPGKTVIRAISADGRISDEMPLTVIFDSVTIKKDGAYNKVVFHSDGKTWYCINNDIVFDDSLRAALIGRCRCNVYKDPDALSKVIQEFSGDELRLLYAIDPHGVAAYVYERVRQLDSLEEILEYKDCVFYTLFGREPKYFSRGINNVWNVTDDKSDLNSVISESEILFGMHPIYDDAVVIDLINVAFDIVSAMLGVFVAKTESIKKIVKISMQVLAAARSLAQGTLKDYIAGVALDTALDAVDIKWAKMFIDALQAAQSVAEPLVDILQDTIVNMDAKKYYNNILEYCIHDTGYNVYMEGKEGKLYKLEDIQEAVIQ